MKGEHDGKACADDEQYLDGWPTGRDLLRGGGRRRTRRRPFHPRTLSAGVPGRGSDTLSVPLEISGYIPTALLGRAMGHPIRFPHKGRLEPALPFWLPVFHPSRAGDVSVLPA